MSKVLRRAFLGCALGVAIVIVGGLVLVLLKLRNYNPEYLWGAEQGWREETLETFGQWIVPFAPGCVLGGAFLAILIKWVRGHLGLSVLFGGCTPIIVFTLTSLVWLIVAVVSMRGSGGYSPDQGLVVLILLVGPMLSIPVIPLWIGAALLLRLGTREPKNPPPLPPS